MIQANELRIGNWLGLKNSEAIKVDADNISDIVNNPAIFEPIPLTLEILEKAGFDLEANRNDDDLIYAKNSIIIDRNRMAVPLENHWAETIYAECKYVHKLQNLYFALTGTELEINLT